MASYKQQSQVSYLSENNGHIKPSITFLILLIGALVAFEIFNFSTTEHALKDMLGDLDFLGVTWSTILAIAFCGIDFAGIARLFSPEQGMDEPKEVWYLFGAWLLAATMNAILTWWGISMAVIDHVMKQNSHVIDPQTMVNIVPVFVAVLVWLIRILIIGSLSLALDRAIHVPTSYQSWRQSSRGGQSHRDNFPLNSSPSYSSPRSSLRLTRTSPSSGFKDRSSSMDNSSLPYRDNYNFGGYEPPDDEVEQPGNFPRPEPTYHSFSAKNQESNRNLREGRTDHDRGDNSRGSKGPNLSRRF